MINAALQSGGEWGIMGTPVRCATTCPAPGRETRHAPITPEHAPDATHYLEIVSPRKPALSQARKRLRGCGISVSPADRTSEENPPR